VWWEVPPPVVGETVRCWPGGLSTGLPIPPAPEALPRPEPLPVAVLDPPYPEPEPLEPEPLEPEPEPDPARLEKKGEKLTGLWGAGKPEQSEP